MAFCNFQWIFVCFCAAAVLGTSSLFAAGPDAQTDVAILEHARAVNADLYASLQSFVCHEQIRRFHTNLDSNATNEIDTVDARLSFERGVEQYSDILKNKHAQKSLSDLEGAWSEGEFGTLLLQTREFLASEKVNFESFENINGAQTALYNFSVDAEQSPWDLTIAGRHYRIPFKTRVWISVTTGEILKIVRTSLSIAPEVRITEIQWSINLDRVPLNGSEWLLPVSGSYSVFYGLSRNRSYNLMSFNDYRRYGSESDLHFY